MQAAFVTTRDGSLLRGVRHALTDAERVIICVAFAAEAGVRLLQTELQTLRTQKRVVDLAATTAFSPATPAALNLAQSLGVNVHVYNPSRGTFHPKVYLGIRGDGRARAVIGSANLTAGLAGNVEAGMLLEGSLRDRPIAEAWRWAEDCLEHPVTEYWVRREGPASTEEAIDPDLLRPLRKEVAKDPVFRTLSGKKPNRVTLLTATSVWVETERSLARGHQPDEVPAWMLNVAWRYLRSQGSLMNSHLLNELRVHRSSAVCALLARIPGVAPIQEGRRIGVKLLQ
ncbi:MAG: phospholipase D family protein [Myxococcota bacterium]|nr:phospholipase D family protein [Myxococcota bacterium]